ncbi:peptidylprolyl isomerase [Suttonella ornithocola]|uniref:Peptidyl-prolyl cis-trans isomerase n=1 Tax=Suttonella ornithocola TaxID=279832 RepID=A0A380MYZ6_9GAMM|nr:Peptidyl-prolyl cis-trans isomerase A precursor [Suttonella ornithocola]
MRKLLLALGFVSLQVLASPTVLMKTSAGEMEIELNENEAPKTVDNFLRYVKEGFYNGTTFHRVIKGFMIQGGGYDVNYEKRPTRGPIASETQNGLKNDRGTIAMARTSDPHSATSQFFINVVNNDFLNPGGADAYGYTVFGKVIKGMDVADKIAALPTTAAGPFSQDVPEKPVIIESIKILPEAENSADKK